MSHATLNPGDIAPPVSLPDSEQALVQLPVKNGRRCVLFFYPRDDTSGCTREAKDFSALLSDFAAAETEVFGISKDSVNKHMKFRDKHGLTVRLLSDENGDTCERYGVWVQKNMYGRQFMGIQRSTFLIGADGKLLRIWRGVKVPGHAEDVLSTARQA